MARRKLNPRLVKIHRNYTVEDIAQLYGVHRNTARSWMKNGLKTIDDSRPVLVHGRDLKDFIRKRRAVNKQPCKAGEIYCVKCRKPKVPVSRGVRYDPVTDTFGNLVGTCPDCGITINRHVSRSKLVELIAQFEITMPEA